MTLVDDGVTPSGSAWPADGNPRTWVRAGLGMDWVGRMAIYKDGAVAKRWNQGYFFSQHHKKWPMKITMIFENNGLSFYFSMPGGSKNGLVKSIAIDTTKT